MGKHTHYELLDEAPITEPIDIRTRVETTTVWRDMWHLLMRIKKFIVALVGAAVIAAQTLPSNNLPTRDNWQDYLPAAIAFLTALGVLGVPNREKKKDNVLQEV